MPDESAFLDTIAQRPRDPGPRVVYADWLEEQGRPEEAELIRLQVRVRELAREQGAGNFHAAEIHQLIRQCGAILNMMGCGNMIQWPPREEDWPDWMGAVRRNMARHVTAKASAELAAQAIARNLDKWYIYTGKPSR